MQVVCIFACCSRAKARPIIACDRCWHSRLTAFLTKGVFQIMTVVFPPGQTFNMLSVQQTIRNMWHSMMGYPATEPTSMVQQDLIGFCNSVPHDRILQALTFTLHLLQGKWGKTVAGTVSAVILPQQGLVFSGISRTSQVRGTQYQDDALGGPSSTDRFHVAFQFLPMWYIHFQADSGSQHGFSSGTVVVHTCCFYH